MNLADPSGEAPWIPCEGDMMSNCANRFELFNLSWGISCICDDPSGDPADDQSLANSGIVFDSDGNGYIFSGITKGSLPPSHGLTDIDIALMFALHDTFPTDVQGVILSAQNLQQPDPQWGPGSGGSTSAAAESGGVLDWVQNGLAFAGMIPALGDLVNVVNAGISVARGNFGDALLYGISAIPFAGIIGEVAVTAKEVETGAQSANVVYRGLAEGEEISGGLFARAANAGNREISHVAGQRASQWISTTKIEQVAMEKYGEFGVVRIDLGKVESTISDISGGFPDVPGMLSNFAKKDQEVLIKNFVPPDAITRIK